MKALVAISGGLKSVVTAWLLKKQGMQLRGVFLDLHETEKSQEKIQAIERKLGISIQIVPAKAAFTEALKIASAEAMASGEVVEPSIFFHKSFLFPKLLALKEQHQFPKLATGHRLLIQEDRISKLFRVYLNSDGDLSEVAYLLGRNQTELAGMLMPLGSIPSSMFGKLSQELNTGSPSEPAIWRAEEFESTDTQTDGLYEVYSTNGLSVGSYKGSSLPKPGQRYFPVDKPDQAFRFTEVSYRQKQIIAQRESDLKIDEIQFQEASWFTRADLGLTTISGGLASKTHPKAIPVRLLQYEGARIKALLNQPLLAQEANIFKGQTMLWIEGNEILGGGRVLGTR